MLALAHRSWHESVQPLKMVVVTGLTSRSYGSTVYTEQQLSSRPLKAVSSTRILW
jgi:hypothetical protein